MTRILRLATIAAICAVVLSVGMGVIAASADEEDSEFSLSESEKAVVDLHASVFRIMSLCESDVVDVTIQAIPDDESEPTFLMVGRVNSNGFARFDKLTADFVDSCIAVAQPMASADQLAQLRASIIADIDAAIPA